MPLSDIIIRNAKPKDKPYKLPDEKGMYLYVHPNGGKYFRLDYRFDDKRQTLSLGTYPTLSLAEARTKVYTAKKQIADNINPSVHKQAIKQAKAESLANSFEVVAQEWLLKKCKDKSDRQPWLLSFLLPYIGSRPIDALKPIDILQCARRVEARGRIETAHRVIRTAGQIFRYAVATARVDRDITQDLKGALETVETKNFAAFTKPVEVGALMRAIDDFQGTFVVHCALKLAPLLFQRPGELRAARWQDFNLEEEQWEYFVTKTKVDHIVPLSRQAFEILMALKPITGDGYWVFPSERNPNNTKEGRCMSENTLSASLKRLGYSGNEATVHGFRATARTMLDERLKFRLDIIEHQLSHVVKDPNGRSYNRTEFLEERHKMMQAWADYLDGLKTGANIISLSQKIRLK